MPSWLGGRWSPLVTSWFQPPASNFPYVATIPPPANGKHNWKEISLSDSISKSWLMLVECPCVVWTFEDSLCSSVRNSTSVWSWKARVSFLRSPMYSLVHLNLCMLVMHYVDPVCFRHDMYSLNDPFHSCPLTIEQLQTHSNMRNDVAISSWPK